MSKFFFFLKLIRVKNLILLALTQILVYFFILKEDIVTDFILLLLITFFITASGYIINNIFDIESDKINKRNLIIGHYIPSRNAIFWYYLFTAISIILIIYLLYLNSNLYPSFIFLSSIYLLWWYSKRYKHIFIIGNFIVSLLTSLCLFNVFLISKNSSLSFFLIIFSILSFLITFSREIIKDLEDLEGDRIMNSQNIASTLNIIQSKQIVIGILILILFVIFIGCYYFLSHITNLQLILMLVYLSFFLIILVFAVFKIMKSKEKKDYNYISSLLKILMFLGVIAIPIIYYIK